MADHVVQYVARANRRNHAGLAVGFEVVTGRDAAGEPTFGGTREVSAGRKVLVLEKDPSTKLPTGVVYEVRQGSPMKPVGAQPLPGQRVTVTCSRSDLAYQAGATWTKLDDGAFVDLLWSIEDRIGLPIADPTPQDPDDLQPEG